MLSDMANVPADTRTFPNASYFRQLFLAIRAIFARYASNFWPIWVSYARYANYPPETRLIYAGYATYPSCVRSYLAGDNQNNQSRVAYNGHRNSREYCVARGIVSLVVGQYIIELL